MSSRKHRWLERIVAFGGLIYWLLTTYIGLAFAAALLTSLTVPSQIRVLAELALVLAAFAALAAHRWRPSVARVAHGAMLAAAAVSFGTCAELVDLPPRYVSFEHRGVQVEYADDGVGRAQPEIRGLIDQVYARSGLPQPSPALRLRFVRNESGGKFRVGDWSRAGADGAAVALSTDQGGTRGSSFLLEASFLLTEALAHRAQPTVLQGPSDGLAYWTMLGVMPQPDWAARWLSGALRPKCADLAYVSLQLRPSGELTIWLPGAQEALHLDAAPFVDAERSGGPQAARALFQQTAAMDSAGWADLVRQHCAA